MRIQEKNLLTGKKTVLLNKIENEDTFSSSMLKIKDEDTFSSSILSSVVAIAHRLFIPRGDVAPEYVYFQACDSLQATCSYLRGILAIHSTLVGVGVGDSQASALSAVATFVLKDGSGMLGSLIFSYGYSHIFDCEVKFWRLFADVINDVGLTLEVIAPLFKDNFLFITVFANICKSLCGVAAGATRVGISQHFATEGNISEVQAKEGTQETFVSMMGLMLGSFLLSRGFMASIHFRLIFFVVLTIIHVYANYLAVKVLQLRTINRGRLRLILTEVEENYFQRKTESNFKTMDLVTPEKASIRETIVPAHYIDFWMYWLRSSSVKADKYTEGCYLRFACSFQVLVTQAKNKVKRQEKKSGGVWSDFINVVDINIVNDELKEYKSRTLTDVLQANDESINDNTYFVVIDETLNTKSISFSHGVSNTVMMFAYCAVVFNKREQQQEIDHFHKRIYASIQTMSKFNWDVSSLHLDEEGFRIESLYNEKNYVNEVRNVVKSKTKELSTIKRRRISSVNMNN
jgi:hypothetical protein